MAYFVLNGVMNREPDTRAVKHHNWIIQRSFKTEPFVKYFIQKCYLESLIITHKKYNV